MHVYVYAYIYIYICTYIHIHTHIHIHIQPGDLRGLGLQWQRGGLGRARVRTALRAT